MRPTSYGPSYADDECRCGHLALDHAQTTIGAGACEFFASGERAGLDGKGWPHCHKFLARSDPDEFRLELWGIRNRRSAVISQRDLARLRTAVGRTPSGAERERHRMTLRDVERRAGAA